MKLAIHNTKWGFSKDWILYCQKKNIPFKVVNCYDSDIVKQLEDCNILLWHHHHTSAKDKVFSKQLLFALEQAGLCVFPNFNTCWHFDDKLGQKYLLEAIEAPLVPTAIFYDKISAVDWISQTDFPKVFKLRGGAGSTNVSLVKSKSQALKLVNTAFREGFKSYDKFGDLKERYRKYKLGIVDFKSILKSLSRIVVSTEFAKIHGAEKGYVLFQDFIPDNQYDVRVVVIGERAFAIKRMVRKGDFRASGSGFIEYNKDQININCIKIAFEVTERLKAQCLAYDFVFDEKNQPLIVEINYGYAHESYFDCPGYWDIDLNWHETNFNSAHWIVDLLTKTA